jgi:hypothetical protein
VYIIIDSFSARFFSFLNIEYNLTLFYDFTISNINRNLVVENKYITNIQIQYGNQSTDSRK